MNRTATWLAAGLAASLVPWGPEDAYASSPSYFSHEGDLDPQLEVGAAPRPWTAALGPAHGIEVGPVSDGPVVGCPGPCPAWKTYDDSADPDSLARYEIALTQAERNVIHEYGAAIAARLRRIAGSPGAGEPASSASSFGFSDGIRSYVLAFGVTSAGDLEIQALDGASVTIGGSESYHWIELILDPITRAANVYVDGNEQITGYAGRADVDAWVRWGSSAGADRARTHWNAVRFGFCDRHAVTGDADGDSLRNCSDDRLFGAFAGRADTDGDGLPDGEEVYRLGTDPRNSDTDGDGLDDWDEVKPEQFGPASIVASDTWAFAVHTADLDGDGDADVVIGDQSGDLVWYENLADYWYGHQFVRRDLIASGLETVEWVDAGDLDGDGDVDLLSASLGSSGIAWHANRLDEPGGGFGPVHVIDPARGARSVHAEDLDGDGDLDVLSASLDDDTIAWYENLSGQFSGARVLSTNADGAHSVHAGDLDGDGDPDVVSASVFDDAIAWFENRLDESSADFSDGTIITTDAQGPNRVLARDLDGDGDADLVWASFRDDTVGWLENRIREDGSFSEPRVLSSDADYAVGIDTADVDWDGDPDVLAASAYDGTVAWYENRLGEPSGDLSAARVIRTGGRDTWRVLAADLDGDRAPDALAIAGPDVVWHRNLGFTSDPLAADTDDDGLQDYEERWFGTSAWLPDSDSDGLSDAEEALGYGTDPLRADSDGDGLSDATEVAIDGLDPRGPDSDGDGFLDGAEDCPLAPEASVDADRDGLCGNADNCPDVANTDQADGDGDGIGDACDGVTICSDAGPGWRALRPARYRFEGRTGEGIVLELSAADGTGGRAALVLTDRVRALRFREVEHGPVPLSLQTALPADGTYEIRVWGPRPRGPWVAVAEPHCLLLDSSADAASTLRRMAR